MSEQSKDERKAIKVRWNGANYLLTFDDPTRPDIVTGLFTKFPNPYPNVFGKSLAQIAEEFTSMEFKRDN